jgi:type II secretory ATPase GspE/PulE/Tfp pilus assembly ATPase PilB-like protein
MGVKDTFLGRLLGNADKFSDEQVSQTIMLLIEHGVKHNATDIHIEPHERFVQVRYRIQNHLKAVHKLPLAALPAVVTQIKQSAHLRISEEHLPQEGQYQVLVGEDSFEIQVYTMPVIGGEKIVLHITRRLAQPPSPEELGFWGDNLHNLRIALTAPYGLAVVAAPRRNGKNTTMHSMLSLITTPAVSVATVEEEITYRIPGVSQTVARPHRGITFYEGLQAALKQDPNIVMVSNTPDKQTINTAIQAAIGGHHLITGINADNAIKALAHLAAAAEEDFLLAHATRVVVSQRLVRKLCARCRVAYTPSTEEISEIESTFGIASTVSRHKIHQLEKAAAAAQLGGHAEHHTTPTKIAKLWRASDTGCEACGNTGYRGTTGVNEVLDTTSTAIQNALIGGASARELRKIALKDGFIPMELDGLVKALRGQTTIAEILRALAI